LGEYKSRDAALQLRQFQVFVQARKTNLVKMKFLVAIIVALAGVNVNK
jgi:hypothetical protein